MLKKIIRANFQRIIELLPKKLSISSQKYGFEISDPGVKQATDPGSATLWESLPVMGRALGRMGMIRRASRFQVSQLSAPHSLHTTYNPSINKSHKEQKNYCRYRYLND
jgi:hypothetical protein